MGSLRVEGYHQSLTTVTLVYDRGGQSYPVRASVGAGFLSNQAGAKPESFESQANLVSQIFLAFSRHWSGFWSMKTLWELLT